MEDVQEIREYRDLFPNIDVIRDEDLSWFVPFLRNLGASDGQIASLRKFKYSSKGNICFQDGFVPDLYSVRPSTRSFTSKNMEYLFQGSLSHAGGGDYSGLPPGVRQKLEKIGKQKQRETMIRECRNGFRDGLMREGLSRQQAASISEQIRLSGSDTDSGVTLTYMGFWFTGKTLKSQDGAAPAAVHFIRWLCLLPDVVVHAFKTVKNDPSPAKYPDVRYLSGISFVSLEPVGKTTDLTQPPEKLKISLRAKVRFTEEAPGYSEMIQMTIQTKKEDLESAVAKAFTESRLISHLVPLMGADISPAEEAFDCYCEKLLASSPGKKLRCMPAKTVAESCPPKMIDAVRGILYHEPLTGNFELKRKAVSGLMFEGDYYGAYVVLNLTEKKAAVTEDKSAVSRKTLALLLKTIRCREKVEEFLQKHVQPFCPRFMSEVSWDRDSSRIDTKISLPEGGKAWSLQVSEFEGDFTAFKSEIKSLDLPHIEQREKEKYQSDPLYGDEIVKGLLCFMQENGKSSAANAIKNIRQVQQNSSYIPKSCGYTDAFSIVSAEDVRRTLNLLESRGLIRSWWALGTYGRFEMVQSVQGGEEAAMRSAGPSHYPGKDYESYTDVDWETFLRNTQAPSVKDWFALLPVLDHPAVFDLASDSLRQFFCSAPDNFLAYLDAVKATLDPGQKKICVMMLLKMAGGKA